MLIKIDVFFDDDAQAYIATSRDIRGLVIEAESLDVLKNEVQELIPALLQLNLPKLRKKPVADLAFTQHLSYS
ncbi:MAG: DUF1902 domain-containing protein [Halothiobacillaceae bacterium]